MIGRRLWILGGAAWSVWPAEARDTALLEVWRDPNCGCCSGWVRHLRTAGFTVRDIVAPTLEPIRRMLGTPVDLLSCHAGRIDGYVLEGHVPASAIRRLLAERPIGIRGLAVPEMPIGSPGMEVPGEPDDIYEVIAFDGSQQRIIFMRFQGGRAL